MALLFSDSWNYFFNKFNNLPQTNWAQVGLWFGQFSFGILDNLLKVNAYTVGLIEHVLIAIIFSIAYILFLKYIIKTTANLLNGLLFGLMLAFFPLIIQLPSMGYSLLNDSHLILYRIISYHALFGIGLGVGGILARKFIPRSD